MTLQVSRVTFLLFPRDDDHFAEQVESIAGADGSMADFWRLEQRLRAFYPSAVVRPRDPLGELDPTIQTWYVYRDGSASSSHA